MQPRKSSISANGDQSVNSFVLQIFVGFLPTCFCLELFTARCLQDGASALNDVTHGARSELDQVTFDHTLISSHNAVCLDLVIRARADYSTNSSIHSRSISAGCKHADLTYFLLHEN